MSGSLFLDAQFTRGLIDRLLEQFPDLADDADLRSDMIEGETDAIKIVQRALTKRLEAQAMVEAIKSREADLAERRARFARQGDAMRDLIKGLMKAAKLKSLALPEATVSLLPGKDSVGISDLADLPQGFFKTKREADKDAIKRSLDAGDDVPGAYRVIGSESVSIRTK